MSELWGVDIKLLRNLDYQYDRARGEDLSVHESQNKTSSETLVDLDLWDLDSNLKQALLLRFLTPVGEMAELGHPDYGSRLSTLIGELNNSTNRNRAKLYVLQALTAEPRVNKVLSVTVTQNDNDRTQMDIAISLLAIDSQTPINLVFPLNVEGGSGA